MLFDREFGDGILHVEWRLAKSGNPSPRTGAFVRTSPKVAESVKYLCNVFHALKITFANETARLCEALGVDPFEVMDLVCRDTQLNISRAYLKPGFAFGGSCLPKDLRATTYLAKTRDVELPMLAVGAPTRVAGLRRTGPHWDRCATASRRTRC